MSAIKRQLEEVSIVPPKVITISGQLTEERESFIALHNPLSQLVMFKLKPSKQITVRPRFGYVRPRGELLVKVKAKAQKDETVSQKEKIRITLAFAPKLPPSSPKQAWKDSKPETTLNRKLKIVFEVERESTTTEEEDDVSPSSEKSSKRSEKEEKVKKKT